MRRQQSKKNPARGAPVNLSEYLAGIGGKVFAVSSFLYSFR
jgi:hypothetical protein